MALDFVTVLSKGGLHNNSGLLITFISYGSTKKEKRKLALIILNCFIYF